MHVEAFSTESGFKFSKNHQLVKYLTVLKTLKCVNYIKTLKLMSSLKIIEIKHFTTELMEKDSWIY